MDHTPTAIVTGASRGIGLGLAKALLSSGYHVVANARHISRAATLAPSSHLVLVDGDVADPETAASLTRTAVERFGSVDLLVNNAGVFIAKPFADSTVDDYQRLVATNLTGFLHVTQSAVRQMRTQASGHIVTITTSLASQPIQGVSASLAILTKGGLNAITRALAIEYAKDGIRVNAVAPGMVDTAMLAVPTPAPVALSGAWTADTVFTVKLVAPETPFYSMLEFRFSAKGERLTLASEYNVSFGGPQPVVLIGASGPR